MKAAHRWLRGGMARTWSSSESEMLLRECDPFRSASIAVRRRARLLVPMLRVLVMVSMLVAFSEPAHATTCEGPSVCCVQGVNHDGRHRVVALGVVVMGLSNINERSGTWD